MKVFKECCKNCLLTNDRIVSSARAKEIINECVEKQSFFICHKSSMQDKDEKIMCKSFHDKFGHHSQLLRIAERLNAVRFVEQTDSEKLPTYNETTTKK